MLTLETKFMDKIRWNCQIRGCVLFVISKSSDLLILSFCSFTCCMQILCCFSLIANFNCFNSCRSDKVKWPDVKSGWLSCKGINSLSVHRFENFHLSKQRIYLLFMDSHVCTTALAVVSMNFVLHLAFFFSHCVCFNVSDVCWCNVLIGCVLFLYLTVWRIW